MYIHYLFEFDESGELGSGGDESFEVFSYWHVIDYKQEIGEGLIKKEIKDFIKEKYALTGPVAGLF